MPCRDYDDDSQRIKELYEKVSDLTRMLCATCQYVEDKNLSLPDFETSKWWKAHKAADLRAKAAVAKAEKDHQTKLAAYKKLSPEEREALGVKYPRRDEL
jgi:hypothetical protein